MPKELPPAPKRPPAGLIQVGDRWHPRRYGLLKQRDLTCYRGHRIKVGGRPFEISIPCGSAGDEYSQGIQNAARCNAELYVFTTRAGLLWAMDVTQDESRFIDQTAMTPDQIVEYFGVEFPVDKKIA